MPQVNLSTLNGPELRRLLDATRARGEAALSYQILQEMAARRESREARGRSATRRPAEPRIIAVDLGDPIDREDEPPRPPEPEASASGAEPPPRPRKTPPRRRAAPAAAEPVAEIEVETPPPQETNRPRSVWDDDPEPAQDAAAEPKGLGLRLHPPSPEVLRAPLRLRRLPGAGFAAGIAIGVAFGWWVGGAVREPPPPVASAAIPIETAALAPPRAPVTTPVTQPEPPPETPPDAAVAPPELAEAPAPSPDAAEGASDAGGVAVESPSQPSERRTTEMVRTAEIPAAVSGTDSCVAEPSPADRTICGDPELRRLQRELQQAYAEALEAHQDRGLLRQRQLAWRDARNTVSQPDRLARLYEERIRKLNAATAEARRQR